MNMEQKFSKDIYENALKIILDLCKKLNRIPYKREIKEAGVSIIIPTINRYLEKNTGFNSYIDYCHFHGYTQYTEVIVDDKFITSENITLKDLKVLVNIFYKKYNRYPIQKEFKHENNLVGYSTFTRLLSKNNMSMYEFNKIIGNEDGIKVSDYSYEYWLEKFKEESIKLGRALKWEETTSFNLPNPKWFIEHCPNERVTNYNEFVELEAKLTSRYKITKEYASMWLINKQKSLTRPLLAKDLGLIDNNDISANVVRRLWGSFNNMREDLKLNELLKNTTKKYEDVTTIKRDIVRLCAYVYNTEGRIEINQNDWKLLNDIISYSTCARYLKENNTSMRNFIVSIGFEYINVGNGEIKYYDDGELTKSNAEKIFSDYLRKILKLEYNKDYFRDIRYNTLVDNYDGLLDCDYKINYNNKTIYIEIAGMLRDYKDTWYEKEITSKSKEKYRQKLLEKEQMLKRNGLNYLILFPQDINEENLNKLFKQLNIKAS